jgi:hypothetical protein
MNRLYFLKCVEHVMRNRGYGLGLAQRLAARHILNEAGELEHLDEDAQRDLVDQTIDQFLSQGEPV